MDTALSFQNVFKTYQADQEERHALREVTFEIPVGRKIAIVGRSGSGKSTLLHLAGIRSKDFAFDGQSILPLLKGEQNSIREVLFAEYHPRGVHDLYNQTMLTNHWRFTLYPEHPEWGEFFDRIHDPFEHRNLFYEPESINTIKELKKILANSFPPKPTVRARRIAKW